MTKTGRRARIAALIGVAVASSLHFGLCTERSGRDLYLSGWRVPSEIQGFDALVGRSGPFLCPVPSRHRQFLVEDEPGEFYSVRENHFYLRVEDNSAPAGFDGIVTITSQ